ncbi:234_t:CDS:2, partial [Scutellospora calospora]
SIIYGKNSGELGQMGIKVTKMLFETAKPILAPILKTSSKEVDELFESISKEISELDCYQIFFRIYACKK